MSPTQAYSSKNSFNVKETKLVYNLSDKTFAIKDESSW